MISKSLRCLQSLVDKLADHIQFYLDRHSYLTLVQMRLDLYGSTDDRVLRFIEVWSPDDRSKEMAYDKLELRKVKEAKMGWKSTVDLTRKEAIEIITNADLDELSNEDLSTIVEAVNGGESHGHNYRIVDNKDE